MVREEWQEAQEEAGQRRQAGRVVVEVEPLPWGLRAEPFERCVWRQQSGPRDHLAAGGVRTQACRSPTELAPLFETVSQVDVGRAATVVLEGS